jgi:hypothetical protein
MRQSGKSTKIDNQLLNLTIVAKLPSLDLVLKLTCNPVVRYRKKYTIIYNSGSFFGTCSNGPENRSTGAR